MDDYSYVIHMYQVGETIPIQQYKMCILYTRHLVLVLFMRRGYSEPYLSL